MLLLLLTPQKSFDRMNDTPASPTPRRRRWLWLLLILFPIAILLAIAGVVLNSLRQEPRFYVQARTSIANPERRREVKAAFEEKTGQLAESLKEAPAWRQEFTQDEINAWLTDSLPQTEGVKLPEEITKPLVQFASGVVQIGCRVDTEQYRGVLSIALRPRLEDRSLVLVIDEVRAGGLEVPAHQLLDQVSRSLAKSKLPIQLERGEEDRLRIDLTQAEGDWRDVVLSSVSVEEGRLTLEGRREGSIVSPL